MLASASADPATPNEPDAAKPDAEVASTFRVLARELMGGIDSPCKPPLETRDDANEMFFKNQLLATKT